jgi:hypothetical protein
VGGRAFVEGGASFVYVPRIKEVAEGNLGKRSVPYSPCYTHPKGIGAIEWSGEVSNAPEHLGLDVVFNNNITSF